VAATLVHLAAVFHTSKEHRGIVLDPSQWGRLETYVQELLIAFGNADRILMWDLYNEPGNSDLEDKSYDLSVELDAQP